jgi:hypothetical protein
MSNRLQALRNSVSEANLTGRAQTDKGRSLNHAGRAATGPEELRDSLPPI